MVVMQTILQLANYMHTYFYQDVAEKNTSVATGSSVLLCVMLPCTKAYDTYTIKHLKGTVLTRLLTLMMMEINFFGIKLLVLIQKTRTDIMGI